MEKIASLSKPCTECEGLKNGTRSLPDPHEYLVLSRRSESGTAYYQCLVCKANLTCELDGRVPRWRSAS